MAEAKSGDKVSVHYTGTLEDGSVFDSSRGGQPLEFELGAGQVVPGFESAVTGMEEGQTVTEKIACDQAYGERRDELQMEVRRADVPDNIDLEVGKMLQIQTPTGQAMRVQVAGVTDESVTLDANHPLAGKDLTFEIELVAIEAT